MPKPSLRAETPDIEWTELGLPRSGRFDDIYYSVSDELAESQHVFLHGCQLQKRWSAEPGKQSAFLIAELGFGAGLNFLMALQLWRQIPQQQRSFSTLHYIACEKYPPTAEQLQTIHARWPTLNTESSQLLKRYQWQHKGWHRLHITDDVCLDLIIGDGAAALQQRSTRDQKVDAWFLDGFNPKSNPELWEQQLFQLMANHSHAHTALATYSSAGHVRRGLQAAGFAVEKTAGYGSKRHMLCANAMTANPQPVSSKESPWFTYPDPQISEKRAIIVGAGLAGANTAYSLARRGWTVSVYEAGPSVAGGASGIPQLAMRCRLFNEAKLAARFYLQAYCYGLQCFDHLQSLSDAGWHPSGVVQKTHAMNKRQPLLVANISHIYDASIAHAESATDTIYFDHGGWVNPIKLCGTLLHQDGIDLHLDCSIQQLTRAQNT